MKDRLIVALDVDTFEDACMIVDELSDEVSIYKIGLAPFIGYGFKIIDYLKSKDKKFFLDLKFFDIPNTVELAVYQACAMGASMLTLHTIGAKSMIEAAISGKKRYEDKFGKSGAMLLGVTILTSMDQESLTNGMFIEKPIEEAIFGLAKNAYEVGLRGFVASPFEAKLLKDKLGDDIVVVTPGIRMDNSNDDQKRASTPRFAIENKADYIVVGRPIIKAKNPKQVAIACIKNMKGED
ncbi:MAG: orotidine-5'-phosphate decarboxylase [Desulfurella sp.]|uniref:orotidine-5'-phosphate decarboxylase n=1 Tax=Desulfurella sp. TaxID=1962857 RepID=UPI003D14C444